MDYKHSFCVEDYRVRRTRLTIAMVEHKSESLNERLQRIEAYTELTMALGVEFAKSVRESADRVAWHGEG